jgi:competence protein ComEA
MVPGRRTDMMYIGDNVKKWLFMTAGIICIASVFCITALFRGAFAAKEEIIPVSPVSQADEPTASETEPEIWAVYVTGEVLRPGVYEIEPGSRVSDAIRLAGGFTHLADREAINLAAKLKDEAHILAPSVAARDNGVKSAPLTSAQASKPAVAANPATTISYPNGANAEDDTQKIDINTADATGFATLPGIGPKLSQAIVAYRDENGPFGDIEDLRNVGGIGEKRFEAIKELVKTVNQ